jgi:cephalosporin-C deacetylase-like acetyl esterase
LGGAVMAPEKIKPSSPRPDGFDAFWQAKFEELAAVPVNPKLEKVEISNAKVDYYKITMDNIRGSHIQGQLARPKDGEKLPAMLVVQWAGVYGLDKNWILGRAQEGWLVLNIEAHDLPIDQPAQFYKDQDAGALKNYPSIGNDDRETSYFLRMYLSCYRAADYLAHREDWNGKVLVVTGGSQGGLQAIVTGAIHPKISAVVANVPAGCDMLGPDAGRSPGWPMWYWQVQNKDARKVHEASRYYDVVNFAPMVKCPTLVGLGLIDTTCPAAGIYSAVNAMTCPKQVVVMPKSGHQDQNGTQRAYNEASGIFINQARNGDFTLPVKP